MRNVGTKACPFEQALFHSGVPCPRNHWPTYLSYIRHGTLDDYRKRKTEYIASGMDEVEAMHRAADEAVDGLKHKTRQRRRVERDTLLGVGGHEELLRRYRGNAKLTDAHSRRIAKKLLQVSRWATMERALREVGYSEPDIERMMGDLVGAFKTSDEVGQAQWKRTRDSVLRRRAAAEAWEKAEQVEAETVKKLPGVRASKYVKKWTEQHYEKPGAATR